MFEYAEKSCCGPLKDKEEKHIDLAKKMFETIATSSPQTQNEIFNELRTLLLSKAIEELVQLSKQL